MQYLAIGNPVWSAGGWGHVNKCTLRILWAFSQGQWCATINLKKILQIYRQNPAWHLGPEVLPWWCHKQMDITDLTTKCSNGRHKQSYRNNFDVWLISEKSMDSREFVPQNQSAQSSVRELSTPASLTTFGRPSHGKHVRSLYLNCNQNQNRIRLTIGRYHTMHSYVGCVIFMSSGGSIKAFYFPFLLRHTYRHGCVVAEPRKRIDSRGFLQEDRVDQPRAVSVSGQNSALKIQMQLLYVENARLGGGGWGWGVGGGGGGGWVGGSGPKGGLK